MGLQKLYLIDEVIRDLKRLRSEIRDLGCSQTAKKIHSAIKSAEGARRHASLKFQRDYCGPSQKGA